MAVRTSDGADLAVAVSGRPDDTARPLAVLAHGFPDTPSTWRHLAPALAAAGYRVATPWLRGYGASRTGTQRPRIDRLGADLLRVHEAFGGDHRAVLVGHDWGAAASWSAATVGGAATWSAMVAIAVPPEPALHGFLLDLDQLWRSRYQLLAQLPLMERWVHAEALRPLVDLWLRWSPSYVPSSADLRPLREALGTPDAIAAALAYYRTNLVGGLLGRVPRRDGPVPAVPALYIHGADDGCIHQRYAARARPMLQTAHPASIVWVVPGAGHFVHLEQPEQLNSAVLAFLDRVRDV